MFVLPDTRLSYALYPDLGLLITLPLLVLEYFFKKKSRGIPIAEYQTNIRFKILSVNRISGKILPGRRFMLWRSGPGRARPSAWC